jgi:DNA-directed RNA polymerase III subunit RPC4
MLMGTDTSKIIHSNARMGGSSKLGSKVKKEGSLKKGGSGEPEDVLMRDLRNISSDEDDEELRKDIDTINLVSSEDDESEDDGGYRSKKSKLGKSTSGLPPIRITRKDHVERVKSVNTDASSATSAAIRQQAKDSGASVEDVAESALRKGKSTAQGGSTAQTTRPFRGVWGNEGDDIKQEPMDERPDGAHGKDHDGAGSVHLSPTSSPERGKKPRTRRPRRPSSPILQTEEERREYDIKRENLRLLREELGSGTTNDRDKDGDQTMADADSPPDTRQDRLYLFQFPPVLPALVDPEKPEWEEGEQQPGDGAIKVEDEAPLDKHGERSDPKGDRFPRLDRGMAGKLRVHESGRCTISWGSIEMDVNMGIDSQFLQDIVYVDMTKSQQKPAGQQENVAKPEEGGEDSEQQKTNGKGKEPQTTETKHEAMSLGQVKGKFVVTPNWDDLFGGRD